MSDRANRITIRIIIVLIVIFFLITGGIWGYREYMTSDVHLSRIVTAEMNQLLSSQNHITMKKLAANPKTYQFLKNTTATTKVKDTSDYQMQLNHWDGYTTILNTRGVDVYITHVGGYTWKIKRIEVQ